MRKLIVYLEVNGLAEDEDGNPCEAGIKLDTGLVVDDDKYEELLSSIKLSDLAEFLQLMEIKESDCRLISEEDYLTEYGE